MFGVIGARQGDPLGEVLLEVNALSDTLKHQRLGALEATALLRTVMEEINLAVFAFDDQQRQPDDAVDDEHHAITRQRGLTGRLQPFHRDAGG